MKFILLILISIITCSCDKKDDLIAPPITEENTFSCRIDGKLFVAQPNGGFLQFPGIQVIGPNWVLRLRNEESKTLYINLTKNEQGHILQILRADGDQDFLYDENNSVEFDAEDQIYISHDNTGTIKILEWKNDSTLIFIFDELFLYQEDDPTKTIVLTDGKLNINMETLNKD